MQDKSSKTTVGFTDTKFPVSVVMERREKSRGRWSFTEWKATAVLIDDRIENKLPEKHLIHEDPACTRYLWKHFVIELLKDGAESYWNNLMASNPALFVVCRSEEDTNEVEPFLVTPNYDEIIGYLEVDDEVFSLPIPPEIYQWLERYIVNNYIPPIRRKRKRANWDDNSNEQTPPPARRH